MVARLGRPIGCRTSHEFADGAHSSAMFRESRLAHSGSAVTKLVMENGNVNGAQLKLAATKSNANSVPREM